MFDVIELPLLAKLFIDFDFFESSKVRSAASTFHAMRRIVRRFLCHELLTTRTVSLVSLVDAEGDCGDDNDKERGAAVDVRRVVALAARVAAHRLVQRPRAAQPEAAVQFGDDLGTFPKSNAVAHRIDRVSIQCRVDRDHLAH